MGECICSSCRNLKGVMNESGAIEEYECEFGFPSEDCAECDEEECSIVCRNYMCDEEEETAVIKCAGCGKELKQLCSDNEDADAYCVDCYLNKE